MIDITITATRRPEILDRTLKSFFENAFWPMDATVIVNIDPVGPGSVCDTYDVVGKYFPSRLANFPTDASFSKAFHWCWSKTRAPFVFHLEDDWELRHSVEVDRMLRLMTVYPDLAALRLSSFPAGPTPIDMMKNWNRWLPWNGEFYEVKESERHRIGVCGHPTLFRKEFIDKVFPFLDSTGNPEKQFQGTNRRITQELGKWRFGVFSKPGDPAYVFDIGRAWMEKNNLRKSGNKAFFTEWEAAHE